MLKQIAVVEDTPPLVDVNQIEDDDVVNVFMGKHQISKIYLEI